jgi:hypothetical protein
MKFNYARTLKGLTQEQLKVKKSNLEKESTELWDSYFLTDNSMTLDSYNRVNRYLTQIEKRLN